MQPAAMELEPPSDEWVLRDLHETFGASFAHYNSETEELWFPPAGRVLLPEALQLAEASPAQPLLRPQAGDLLTLAVPLGPGRWAVSTFAGSDSAAPGALGEALGWNSEECLAWCNRQQPWTAQGLERVARQWMRRIAAENASRQLSGEVDELSGSLASTFEEVSLLYEVTESMSPTTSIEELVGLLAESILKLLPAEGLAIRLGTECGSESTHLQWGKWPLAEDRFTEMLDLVGGEDLVIINDDHPLLAEFSDIRQLLMAPLRFESQQFGWLVAVNHATQHWFGSVQARLLRCVATILGIHHNNLELYRQRCEMLSEKSQSELRLEHLECQIDHLSDTLDLTCDEVSRSYEEINMLQRVARNAGLVAERSELAQMALRWLIKLIPVEGVAVQYTRTEDGEGGKWPELVTAGNCPLNDSRFRRLVDDLNLDERNEPLVANRNVTAKDTWQYPQVRQLLLVPLSVAGHTHGWLAAVNHQSDKELGTVEASLLSSVAAILCVDALTRMTTIANAPSRLDDLESDVRRLNENNALLCDELSRTYEEVSLLYRVIEGMQSFGRIEDILGVTVDWLRRVVPSRAVGIQFHTPGEKSGFAEPHTMLWGDAGVSQQRLEQAVENLQLKAGSPARIFNRAPDCSGKEQGIDQLVAVPLSSGDRMFGWLAVVNHRDGDGFGTVEAGMISAVATLLGLHRGNLELYHRHGRCLEDVEKSERRVQQLTGEISRLTENVAASREEIDLLHEITQHQRGSNPSLDLAPTILGWLYATLPVEAVLLHWLDGSRNVSQGELPLTPESLREWAGQLNLADLAGPLVLNRSQWRGDDWPCDEVRQLVLAAVWEGDQCLGWLAAVNHQGDVDLGPPEARLLATACSSLSSP